MLALLVGCASATARPSLSPTTPAPIAAALQRMPAPDAESEMVLVEQLLATSDADLSHLFGMIGLAGSEDDRLARYGVGALVTHAGAPGRDLERARVARLLAEAMTAAPAAEPRSFFAAQLQLIGTPASVPALAELLRDAATAEAAIQALTAIGGEMAASELRAALVAGTSESAALLLALARLRDAAAVAPVLSLLNADDDGVRLAALRAAVELAPPAAADLVSAAARSFNGADRGRALAHLMRYAERLQGQGETALAAAILQPLLDDDNAAVRRTAARLLAR